MPITYHTLWPANVLQFDCLMKQYILLSILIVTLISCGQPQSASSKAQIKKTALIANSGKLWKNGSTINVTYKDGTPEIQAEVERFAVEWTKYANLNFKFYKSVKDIPRGQAADVIITFNTNVHTSAVGTDSKIISRNDASMNLGILNDEHINTRRSIVLHEFGHAIGLQHEHQHKDRTIQFDEAKSIEACKKHINFTEEMCRMFILQTFKEGDVYFSKYDLLSIMHYSLHGDFFKTKMDMKNNLSLSLTDKLEIAKMYPGRMNQDQILVTHQSQERELKQITTYKNCKLTERLKERMRPTDKGTVELVQVKDLNISSITPNEFDDLYIWEDLESTIIRMQTLPYCNLDEQELEQQRKKIRAENYQKRSSGSCSVNIDEEGVPTPKSCSSPEYPYEVVKTTTGKRADSLCHPTFESALGVMKHIPVCR